MDRIIRTAIIGIVLMASGQAARADYWSNKAVPNIPLGDNYRTTILLTESIQRPAMCRIEFGTYPILVNGVLKEALEPSQETTPPQNHIPEPTLETMVLEPHGTKKLVIGYLGEFEQTWAIIHVDDGSLKVTVFYELLDETGEVVQTVAVVPTQFSGAGLGGWSGTVSLALDEAPGKRAAMSLFFPRRGPWAVDPLRIPIEMQAFNEQGQLVATATAGASATAKAWTFWPHWWMNLPDTFVGTVIVKSPDTDMWAIAVRLTKEKYSWDWTPLPVLFGGGNDCAPISEGCSYQE